MTFSSYIFQLCFDRLQDHAGVRIPREEHFNALYFDLKYLLVEIYPGTKNNALKSNIV